MGSFDFAKFIKRLRSDIDDKLIDEIEDAWNGGNKEVVKEKCSALRENYQTRLNGSQISELNRLHKKVRAKRKKDGIGTKMLTSQLSHQKEEKESADTKSSGAQQNEEKNPDGNSGEDRELKDEMRSNSKELRRYRETLVEKNEEIAKLERRLQNKDETIQKQGADLANAKKIMTEKDIEIGTLKTRNQDLEEKINMKVTDLANANTSIEEKTVEIKTLTIRNQNLEHQIKTKSTDLEDTNKLIMEKEKQIVTLNKRNQSLEETMKTQNETVENANEKLSERDKEIEAIIIRNQDLEEDIKTKATDLANIYKTMEENTVEIKTLTKRNKELAEQMKTKSSDLEDTNKLIKEKEKELKTLNKRNQKLEETLKRQNEDLEKFNREKVKEIEALKTRLSKLRESMNKKEAQLERSKTSIEEYHRENNDLTTRLSAVAGAKLLNNNPNIADLSDEDRPTKLAEKYSELYDNEWTEAFTALFDDGFGQDQKIIETLLEIFWDCYNESVVQAKQQIQLVKSVLVSPADATKRGENRANEVEEYTFTDLQEKSITDLVKQTANISYKSLLEMSNRVRFSENKHWSTRTSYPSVSRVPTEMGPNSLAIARQVEHTLTHKITKLRANHNTTLRSLHHKRKAVEKSLLGYSERMREISNSRTTALYRDILQQKSNVIDNTNHSDQSSNSANTECSVVDDIKQRNSRQYGNNIGNLTLPFYEIKYTRFPHIANKLRKATASDSTALPKTTLPKLLLKRSSSADLFKRMGDFRPQNSNFISEHVGRKKLRNRG